MSRAILLCLICAIGSLAAISLATGPVTGVWNGKYVYDFSKLPSNLTEKQKTDMIAICKKRAQSKLSLSLKPNFNFSVSTNDSSGKAIPIIGKWTQTAKTIQLQTVKDGKLGVMIELVFDKTGKVMTYANGPATLIFSR